MNVTNRLALFETAQEIFNTLIAIRSEQIYIERSSANPNEEKIAYWQAEQDFFSAQEDALQFDDLEEIERVIRTYGPEVKSTFTNRSE